MMWQARHLSDGCGDRRTPQSQWGCDLLAPCVVGVAVVRAAVTAAEAPALAGTRPRARRHHLLPLLLRPGPPAALTSERPHPSFLPPSPLYRNQLPGLNSFCLRC